MKVCNEKFSYSNQQTLYIEILYSSTIFLQISEINILCYYEFHHLVRANDFSYLLEKKPGSYLYIGQKDSEHKAHLHTTKYDFNDDLLPLGVNFWVQLVKNFFK